MVVIDGYDDLEEIGRGGMAVVYRATQRKLSRKVALKVLPEQLALNKQFLERFQREAVIASKLNHPSIVHVYDIGECAGQHYIAMEFVDGLTLAELLQQHGPLHPTQGPRLVHYVALALEAARLEGVVHRDIKPSNVMIENRTERVVLTDFGIAKAGNCGQALTATGFGMGTPTYMAPEQMSGSEADHRSDIYALGILFFQAMTGEVPFSAESPLVVLHHHLTSAPPLLRSKRPDAPEWVEVIIERCLAKSPDQRYQTAGELARDIQQGLSGRGAEIARPSPAKAATPGLDPTIAFSLPAGAPQRAPKPRQTKAPLGSRDLVMAALVVGLLVLAGREFSRKDSAPPSASPTAPASVSGEPTPIPIVAGDYVNERDGSVLVNVPAGEFLLGDPTRTSSLPAYQIGKYEVTNAQYAKFVESAATTVDNSWREYAGKWGDQAPVVRVSWDDADAYCRWAGLRLPSDAEWERAARGTDGRTYPWGNEWDPSKAVCNVTIGPKEVGSKPEGISPAGCMDMAGNVWEWTNDWYDSTQKYKVYRGGCWNYDNPDFFRCSYRNLCSRDFRNFYLGFRCARTP